MPFFCVVHLSGWQPAFGSMFKYSVWYGIMLYMLDYYYNRIIMC